MIILEMEDGNEMPVNEHRYVDEVARSLAGAPKRIRFVAPNGRELEVGFFCKIIKIYFKLKN
jgi:hypothetical protein